jgi:protein-L-isoaspartate(D-aspartate) O-methyltransferase
MIEALLLKGGEDVLEIGTGSGYAAAILAEIAKNVYSVERIGQLAEKAATTLAKQGYHNVHVRHGDGTRGWPEHGLCVPKTSSAEIPVPAPKFPVPPMASALFAPR